MGGRGTFAAGNPVEYTYKTVAKIEGVKVLEPIDSRKSFNMPAEAHRSQAYIVLDKVGVFRQYREYNDEHFPVFEIGYHFEKNLSRAGEAVLHVHEYRFPGVENRGKARKLKSWELKKYRKFLKGVQF